MWDSLTPEQRFKAKLCKHRPRTKRVKEESAQNLEGDMPPARGRTKLPQTPERVKANAYAREYQRRKRANSQPDW